MGLLCVPVTDERKPVQREADSYLGHTTIPQTIDTTTTENLQVLFLSLRLLRPPSIANLFSILPFLFGVTKRLSF